MPMTTTMRVGLLTLAALLAVAAPVAAQSYGTGTTTITTDAADAAAEGGLYGDGNYGDLDAGAAADGAAAAVDADGSMSDVEDAAEGGFFTWLSLHASAFFAVLAETLGIDAPTTADAKVDAYLSDDGVDLDATVTGLPCAALPEAPVALPETPEIPVETPAVPCGTVDYDASPAGDADGKTWEAMGEVNGLVDGLPQ